MSSFRPSLTEDDRQTLIDVMEFACGRLRAFDASTLVSAEHFETKQLANKIAGRKVRELRSKLFPDLYPPNGAKK